jgi:hypothetical protein
MKISMPRMGALILSLGLLAAPYTASAQDAGNVIINSNPQGAVVKLIGEMTLSGITPVKFDRSLSGKYKIEVVREGFEKYRSVTYFTEKQASQLDIKLTPKTRAKAFVRSMIIPGWGQKYYGNSTKAGFYLLAIAASSAGYFIVRDDYNTKVDSYNAAKAAYVSARRWSDLSTLGQQLYDAQKKANDAENRVNIAIGVVAGLYALNVLDCLLFFPENDSFTEYKALTARPEISPNQVGITLSLKF